jgi:hypothetical protein
MYQVECICHKLVSMCYVISNIKFLNEMLHIQLEKTIRHLKFKSFIQTVDITIQVITRYYN